MLLVWTPEGTDPGVIKQLLVIDYTLETQQCGAPASEPCLVSPRDESSRLSAAQECFGPGHDETSLDFHSLLTSCELC